MTTSGTTVWMVTAAELIRTALIENAIIGIADVPTAAEQTECLTRLNGMLKSWQMKGLSWKQETITQATVAAIATVTLPAYVREVNGVRFVDSSNFERVLQRFERDEYFRLPNKASAGRSTAYYVERSTNGLTLYLWPVPATISSLKLDIDRAMDTVTAGSETVDIPEELHETLYACLAVRCAGIFGQQALPELVQRAAMLEREMLDNYRPASYYLEAY